MARLFMSGWEMGNVLDGGIFDTNSGTGMTVAAGAARSGIYGMKIALAAANVADLDKRFVPAAGTTNDYYFRTYLKIVTPISDRTCILYVEDGSGVGGATYQLKLNANNTLELWDDDSQIGSDSPALTTGAWYRIEVGYVYSTRIATAYIDGVSFASGAMNATFDQPSYLAIGFIQINPGDAAVTGEVMWDDLALNDSTGTAENGLPGAEQIIQLLPNAAGDNAMGSRGGTDSGSDWDQLNEAPPNDATDYYILDVDNDIIDVNIQPATLYMNSYDTINVVQVCVRHAAASAAAFGYAARIKSQASGTVATGDTKTHDDITWRTNGDAAPRLPSLTSYTDPQAAGVWTPALLDTAQIGVICTDATPDMWITSLWALVGYEPETPAAPTDAGGVKNLSHGLLPRLPLRSFRVRR